MDDRYAELGRRIDAFHDRVQDAHPGALTCHAGCHRCCEVHLTVLTLEFRRIAAAVRNLPADQHAEIRARVSSDRTDPRCPLLDDAGRCRVYNARPMICRSHGLPIAVGDPPRRDVCTLNFTEGPVVDALDPNVVLDVNHVNLILATMDHVESKTPGERIDLFDGLSALLEDVT